MIRDLIPVVSCLGDDSGGGIFAIAGGEAHQIDALSTTGITAADGKFARVLWNEELGAELLVYDERGVLRYSRIDEAAEPHDLAWDGRELLLVSTATNSLLWIDQGGQVVKEWTAPGEGDSWHLNSVLVDRGALYVCAFGEYSEHRGWDNPSRAGAGFVMDLATRRKTIAGLSAPHHPRLSGEAWLVCNSGKRELLEVDAKTGEIRRSKPLGGWTRGLALTPEAVLVGLSASRQDAESGTNAVLVVLGRESWEVIDEIPLPAREIYDVALVTPAQVDALRRGFRTNRRRIAEHNQLMMFEEAGIAPHRLWAVADPLPPAACRVGISAEPVIRAAVREVIRVDSDVTNLGGAFLVSAPPNPVHASYRWRDPASGEALDESEPLRTPLPATLPPGESARVQFRVQAPDEPGTWELHLTLVQELVTWFDDVDPTNGFSCTVEVTELV